MGSHQPEAGVAAPADGHTTALILAGGANTRLQGVVPPFMKPLVVVNGRTLFRHAFDHAPIWHADRAVAVVSPENIGPLTKLNLGDNWTRLKYVSDWIVQPHPIGIIDAIKRGLVAVRSPWTLVMCADNTFDIESAALFHLDRSLKEPWSLFGARHLSHEEERRFTRYDVRDDRVYFIEASDAAPGIGCWIGPLLVPTLDLSVAAHNSRNRTIVDCLNEMACKRRFVSVPMYCNDLGIPEAL